MNTLIFIHIHIHIQICIKIVFIKKLHSQFNETYDVDNVETKLKELFARQFIKREDYGYEYFEGDLDKMKELILDNILLEPV